MSSGPLDPAASAFIDAMCAELSALSARPPAAFEREAAVEAANIVAGVIDADGRQTQSELEGYLDALGARLDPHSPRRLASCASRTCSPAAPRGCTSRA